MVAGKLWGTQSSGVKISQDLADILEAFVGKAPKRMALNGGNPDSIWDNAFTVHITSFWGWTPESWGTVGYTLSGRRETVLRETTDPFIMVVYVTRSAPAASKDLRGKIAGFYLVSHEIGHRDKFTAPKHHNRNPDKWQYSLRALRAFSFLPEYRLDIDDYDPTMAERARSVAANGEVVPNNLVERIRNLPYVEVPVYGGADITNAVIHAPSSGTGMVRPGPVNRSGYYVDGEPPETEKELYALRLSGDMDVFLGEPARGRRIYKIGLSMSPKTRLEALRRSLPKGTFGWDLSISTRSKFSKPYPNFEMAVAGENVLKKVLARKGTWLGGEFYAATDAVLEEAWQSAHAAALKKKAR